MIPKESNYIQQIYRIIVFLIGLWFLNLVWPYISDVILMLVFAFLFTTILLSSVDAFERRIGNRNLSVLGVVVVLLGAITTFLGSFISQISYQAQEFSQRVDQETMTNEFKILGEFNSCHSDNGSIFNNFSESNILIRINYFIQL